MLPVFFDCCKPQRYSELVILHDVLFDGLEAFGAYDVFHLAGVINGRLFIDAELYEPAGNEHVPLIDGLGDLLSRVGQINKAGIGHRDQLFHAEILHADGNAGLFEAEFIRYIDAAHNGKLLGEHEDGLQVVFRGFIDCCHIHILSGTGRIVSGSDVSEIFLILP